jgi:hypothetical protein
VRHCVKRRKKRLAFRKHRLHWQQLLRIQNVRFSPPWVLIVVFVGVAACRNGGGGQMKNPRFRMGLPPLPLGDGKFLPNVYNYQFDTVRYSQGSYRYCWPHHVYADSSSSLFFISLIGLRHVTIPAYDLLLSMPSIYRSIGITNPMWKSFKRQCETNVVDERLVQRMLLQTMS